MAAFHFEGGTTEDGKRPVVILHSPFEMEIDGVVTKTVRFEGEEGGELAEVRASAMKWLEDRVRRTNKQYAEEQGGVASLPQLDWGNAK
jgi:hypothetical protein